MKKTENLSGLQKASEGLLLPSETDAPFEAFEWPGEQGKPDKTRVVELAGGATGTPVKVKSLDAFFKDATAEQDWHDEQEQEQVQRFQQLVRTLKETLADAKVLQLGKGPRKKPTSSAAPMRAGRG
jgi:hypothetical protein